MPNNCYFTCNAKGTPENLKRFMKLFVYEDDTNKDEKEKPYFARTFLDSYKRYDYFLEEHIEEIEKGDITFMGWCAWSCHSCLFEGYPNQKEGLVTLEWACKEYNIELEIQSEETGCCFEENISFEKGKMNYSSNDMPTYVCECGEERSFPSDCDYLEDEECDCGKVGKWSLVK